MEAIIRMAVEVCDDDSVGLEYGEGSMYQSRYKKALQWKYRKQHFFSFTQRTKEMIVFGIYLAMFMFALSYGVAHFLLYITK